MVSVAQLIAIGVTDPREQASLLGFDPQQDTSPLPAKGPSSNPLPSSSALPALCASVEVEGGRSEGAGRPGRCENCKRQPSDPSLNGQFLTCGSCRRVDYCSLDCQRQHWLSAHRLVCSEMAQDSKASLRPHNEAEPAANTGAQASPALHHQQPAGQVSESSCGLGRRVMTDVLRHVPHTHQQPARSDGDIFEEALTKLLRSAISESAFKQRLQVLGKGGQGFRLAKAWWMTSATCLRFANISGNRERERERVQGGEADACQGRGRGGSRDKGLGGGSGQRKASALHAQSGRGARGNDAWR